MPAANRTVTRAQAQEVDRRAWEEYGVSGLVVMENAGRGAADVLCRRLPALDEQAGRRRPVVLCCGKGNNAGDGFVIARHLDLRGHAVRVLLWADPAELTGDAAVNYRILTKTDVPIDLLHNDRDDARLEKLLDGASWIVDALLGTGARGEPRPPLDRVIDRINAQAAPTLAVDLPSGLDCDTGLPATHTIRAAVTCTFVAEKIGFATAEARPFLGEVFVLDIGTPRKLIDRVLRESDR